MKIRNRGTYWSEVSVFSGSSRHLTYIYTRLTRQRLVINVKSPLQISSSPVIGNRVHNIGALVFVWKPSTAVFAHSYWSSRLVSFSVIRLPNNI